MTSHESFGAIHTPYICKKSMENYLVDLEEQKNQQVNTILHKQKGITLIALVVTIVILLILAAITLNLLFSDTGLFEKAQQSEDAYKIGALKDQIYTIVLDWEADKKIPETAKDTDLDDLWDKLLEADIIDNKEEDIEKIEDKENTYEITSNEGYVVEIIVKDDGTVEIGDIEKEDNLPPKIENINSNSTTSSIHIEVEIKRLQEGKISYYYKKDSEEDYQSLKEEVTELTADFTGLEQNVVYNIKVAAENKNGRTEKVINERTGELVEGAIRQVGDPEWNNGKATLKLETTVTGVSIVYQVGNIDGTWLPYPEEGIGGLDHEDIVYAAISDGTNVSKESSFEIEDGIAPIVNIAQGAITTRSIGVSISVIDKEWGMPEPPTYHYYIKKSTENSYPSTASYTGPNTSYTFDNLSQTTSYDIKVITTDKAGNEGSKELTGISTGTVGGATGNLVSGNIIASNPTWSGGKASITLSKGSEVASNLSIQWQKNSISGTWTTGTSVTGLNHNDIVYARLTDGVNAGSHASVTIKDGTAPTVNITKGTVTTKSIAVSVSSSDSQWGMPSSISYSYYIKTSSATSYPTAASYTGTNASYTFNNLNQNTNYDIRVTTKDKAGNTGSKDLTGTKTGAIGGATSGLISGNIIASSPTWSGGKASITLSKGSGVASNLSIQWQKNSISGTWTTGTSVTGLNHNDIVYARLTDGRNSGSHASVTIKDTIAPTISSFVSTSKSYTDITVKVTASDAQSGLATSGTYQYYLGNTLKSTSTSATYTYSGLSAGTQYTLKVIVKDKAGVTATRSINVTTNNYSTVTSLEEGEYVEYRDTRGNTWTCVVLYDSSSRYGIQIITADTVGTVTLKGEDGYNNAISTLNDKALDYLNTTYASDARCVGSKPNNKNSQSGTISYMGHTMRDTDTNYETDYDQMTSLGIRTIGEEYWLASRFVSRWADSYEFGMYYVTSQWQSAIETLFEVAKDEYYTYAGTFSYGLRPVFTLKSGIKIIGGDGTKNSPYRLGK